jgi:hypothetical protein
MDDGHFSYMKEKYPNVQRDQCFFFFPHFFHIEILAKLNQK